MQPYRTQAERIEIPPCRREQARRLLALAILAPVRLATYAAPLFIGNVGLALVLVGPIAAGHYELVGWCFAVGNAVAVALYGTWRAHQWAERVVEAEDE